METMQQEEMVHLRGGAVGGATVCGFGAGLTFAAFFFGGAALGIYTASKAIGACAIALAVN